MVTAGMKKPSEGDRSGMKGRQCLRIGFYNFEEGPGWTSRSHAALLPVLQCLGSDADQKSKAGLGQSCALTDGLDVGFGKLANHSACNLFSAHVQAHVPDAGQQFIKLSVIHIAAPPASNRPMLSTAPWSNSQPRFWRRHRPDNTVAH